MSNYIRLTFCLLILSKLSLCFAQGGQQKPAQTQTPASQASMQAALQVRTEQIRMAESLKGTPYYWFTKTYFFVTGDEIMRAQRGDFQNADIVMKEVISFHQLYATNLKNWVAGRKDQVDPHWREAFSQMDRAFNYGPARLLDPTEAFRGGAARAIIEGSRAHIQGDLPRAINAVFEEERRRNPNLRIEDLRADYDKMMSTFDKAYEFIKPELPPSERLKLSTAESVKLDKVALKLGMNFDMEKERAQVFGKVTQSVGKQSSVPTQSDTQYNPSSLTPKEREARKQTEKIIAAETLHPPGPGNNPPKPGGILLNKAAEFLGDLRDIMGAVFDARTQQVVLIGKRNLPLPSMDKDLFAVAMRAAYDGKPIAVSIDPTASPEVMKVRYFGQTENTRLGWVMFEADRILKNLTLGRDNVTGQPIRSSVYGYRNILDRESNEPGSSVGYALYRFWFKPKELELQKSADGRSMLFTKATMDCSWEQMQGVPAPGKAVQDFVEHLNRNYGDYSRDYGVLQELTQLAKVVGVAKWLRDQGLFIDLASLGIKERYTPDTTPAITAEITKKSVDGILVRWQQRSMTGGVDFTKPNSYVPDQDQRVAGLKLAVLKSRPADRQQASWDFEMNGERLTAVAIPASDRRFTRVIRYSSIKWVPSGPIITNYSINGIGPYPVITLLGQGFGVRSARSQVTLNSKPIGVLNWSGQKVVVKVPENSEGGRLTIVSGGQQSNALVLRSVPRPKPAMTTVRVVNEINAPLHLTVGTRRLVIRARGSEVIVIPAGRYDFTAVAGTARDSGSKEFESGETTWTFHGRVTPIAPVIQEPLITGPTAELTIDNQSNIAISVTIDGPRKKTVVTVQRGSKTITLPVGIYKISARGGNAVSPPETYTLEEGSNVTVTYKIIVRWVR